jgi:putative endonuclease
MNEKYFFYILKCYDGTKYFGHTNNLTNRFGFHKKGFVAYTRNRRPIELVYFEEFSERSQAFKREMQFKNGKTRKETIENLINSFSRAKCQGFNSPRNLRSLTFRKLRAH